MKRIFFDFHKLLIPRLFLLIFSCLLSSLSFASTKPFPTYDKEKSIARIWNEVTLKLISLDFARPTVHARNLFHSSAMMYDLWAIFDASAQPYFLGVNHGLTSCAFSKRDKEKYQLKFEVQGAAFIAEAISFAMYRLLVHRFSRSPDFQDETILQLQLLFKQLGYDYQLNHINIETAEAFALGNYIAKCVIEYGVHDGANEQHDYINSGYQAFNEPHNPSDDGLTGLKDPNRWQPLDLADSVDQSGFEIDTPIFIGANWGQVTPFSLNISDATRYSRDGIKYIVYHDPGAPPLFREPSFTWNHLLVAKWSAHLDPGDGVVWDISPATQGQTGDLPVNHEEYKAFYSDDGVIPQKGHAINPATRQPYKPQYVPRGDYTRVLAEFWADGPHSETPPGHWFSIMNDLVNDHPLFERKFLGLGESYSALEWDIKSYFALGAAMHDAAITAWSIKGWYDYVRPLSAIRYLGSLGQSSDKSKKNYDPQGIPLEKDFSELIKFGDPAHLTGYSNEHLGKLKLRVWRGPPYVRGSPLGIAEVEWLSPSQWWPYQRPTFVTPPFAGYISGHSTFSSAAAEVLQRLTGDEYFPGGMGEYKIKANEFLSFERGPSVDITLQWATYRDASDQTSLSRIWGGIHPPIDDIPGRNIGREVGAQAFQKARSYFDGALLDESPKINRKLVCQRPIMFGAIFIISLIILLKLIFYRAPKKKSQL